MDPRLINLLEDRLHKYRKREKNGLMYVNYYKIVRFVFSLAGGLIKINIALSFISIRTHDDKQKYILIVFLKFKSSS